MLLFSRFFFSLFCTLDVRVSRIFRRMNTISQKQEKQQEDEQAKKHFKHYFWHPHIPKQIAVLQLQKKNGYFHLFFVVFALRIDYLSLGNSSFLLSPSSLFPFVPKSRALPMCFVCFFFRIHIVCRKQRISVYLIRLVLLCFALAQNDWANEREWFIALTKVLDQITNPKWMHQSIRKHNKCFLCVMRELFMSRSIFGLSRHTLETSTHTRNLSFTFVMREINGDGARTAAQASGICANKTDRERERERETEHTKRFGYIFQNYNRKFHLFLLL